MKTIRVLLLLVLSAAFCTKALTQTTLGRQVVDQYPTTSWGTLTYGLTWLPPDYNSTTTKYPLIIFLHGSGEGGDGVSGLNNLLIYGLPNRIANGWNPQAVNPNDGQNYQFIVVSPQAPSAAHWSYAWGSLQWILANVESRYRIDTSRIYVTGISAGGAGTWSCATNGFAAAQKFPAIVPVSAAGTNSQAEADQIPLVGGTYGVKVWSVTGANDAWLSFATNATNSINNAIPAPAVPALLTPIPNAGHEPAAWNTPYDPNWRNNSQNLNIYEWMLKYKRTLNTPSASAGPNQTITLPLNSVTLNGSGTPGSGNTITGYAWTKVSGPASYIIASPTTPVTLITGLTQGTYVFRLTVTDNLNVTASSDVTITVNPIPNILPVALAGLDQTITLPANAVTLNGSGTDADGTVSSYLWSKISGPSSYSIGTPSAAQTDINSLVQGVYQFELKITDNAGGVGRDTVTVTVNAGANIAPVANAGADQSVTLPGNSVIVTGSGTDADGTIASYAWTKLSGPAQYNIATPAVAQTTINNLAQGLYQFELKVTDNMGASARDTVVVTVFPAPNQAPAAQAGTDQVITLPANNVTLNGSGTDNDGTITAYAWTKISGPAAFVIGTPSQAQTTVTGLVQGIYQFRLQVTDNNGATASDTMTVTVNPAPNVPPVASAGNDQSITFPANSVTLTGSGTDADGSISSYAWTKISGPALYNIVSPTQAQTSVNNLAEGVYQFRLQVTDNSGASSYDTVNVTVNAAPPANQPPVANAGADQSITLPLNTVTLNGSGTDNDGTVASYLWALVSGPSTYSIVSASSAQTSVNGLVQGIYGFELTVTDNDGASATDTLYITVNDAANQLPSVMAGTDQVITLPTDSVTVTGTAADNDGTIVSYQWAMVSAPGAFVIESPNQAETNINGLVQGIYLFSLTVTDNNGGTSSDTLQVTVNSQPNILPVVFAGNDTSITLPQDSILLQGQATDPDGTILTYAWSMISGPSVAVMADSTQSQTMVNSLVAGIYRFALEVKDDQGGISMDTVLVTVNAAGNLAPLADAGMDTTINLPLNSINLQGTGTDTDGMITAYSWSKVSGPSQYNIVTPAQANTDITNLMQGVYTFELMVTDDQGAVGRDTIIVTVNPDSSIVHCNGVKQYFVPAADGGKYMTADPTSVWYRNINPGDTLVLSAQYAWNYFSLEGFSGTASCPIVVMNEGGQVWMTSGISTVDCRYMKITGSGDANNYYGFRVYNPGNDGSGVAVSIQGKAKNIEVERVDVYKKTYGIWAKQDPLCDQSYNYPNYVMDSIEIHHCRFRNIGQDCIYAGNTDPTGQRDIWCNGVLQHFIPMRLSNINIHHLLIDSCNRTGIQLSGADQGYNQIHDNVVTRCGYEYNQQQGTGISIGGMTRNCHVYNNTIRNTFLYGILDFGAGVNYIENNIIDSSGWLDGVPNTVSRPSNIIASTKNPIPFDSTTVIIRFNRLGTNATTDSTNIAVVVWGPAIWTVNNVICSNTKLNTTQPALAYIAPSIHYINDCSGALPNMPPTAYAGPDQIIPTAGTTVSLNGSGSDPDGVITGYKWTFLSGPSQYVITDPEAAQTTLTGLVQGNYTFRLQVTDDDTLTAIDDIQISVAPPNVAPLANAGINQVIYLPTSTVTLNGSGVDQDGSIVSYHWTKISGPSATIVNAANPQTQVNGLVQGVYLFELKVVDDSAAFDTDTVMVTVNPAPPPTNLAPVAHAGADQVITLPTNFVTLHGNGTDADGSISSFSWSKLSGPSSYSISNTAQAQPYVSGLVQGTYQFVLAVMDNHGAVGKDTVMVTVNPMPNQSPVAHAGADITITLPTNTVHLSGSATDADGTISAYMWSKISGPSTYTIAASGSAQTAVDNLVQGVYQFELRVFDNDGAEDRDTVIVTVNALPNVPPVAHAGTDQVITLPTNSITLSGSGTDTDGSITAYTWNKITGPAGCSIINAASAQSTVTGMVQGIYQFTLRVRDDDGAYGYDTVTVTVNAQPNLPPVAHAGSDISITLPASSITLNGSGTDADGSITAFAWTKLTGPAQFNMLSPAQAQTVVNSLVQGVYTFQLKVTDNSGATATDTIKVTVNPAPNVAPVAHAGLDVVLTLPVNNTSLNGSGTDVDGSIVAYQWSRLSGPSSYVIANASSAQTTLSNLVQGVYQFELKVTDNLGASGKDTISVVVNAPVVNPTNLAPVAHAGPDQTISLPTDFTNLDGSGDDADGTVVSYIWTKISGPVSYNISNPVQPHTTISSLVEGSYLFELKVTDNEGAIGRDTVMVKVGPDLRTVSTATLYPNPAPGSYIYIRMDAITHRNLTHLKIYDAKGSLVYQEDFLRDLQVMVKRVDVSRLEPGAYFVNMDVDINTVITLKFIKE